MSEAKSAPVQKPVLNRHLENLKVREARLKHKLENRMSGAQYAEGHSEEQSTARTTRHLAQIRAEIKKASKA